MSKTNEAAYYSLLYNHIFYEGLAQEGGLAPQAREGDLEPLFAKQFQDNEQLFVTPPSIQLV